MIGSGGYLPKRPEPNPWRAQRRALSFFYGRRVSWEEVRRHGLRPAYWDAPKSVWSGREILAWRRARRRLSRQATRGWRKCGTFPAGAD